MKISRKVWAALLLAGLAGCATTNTLSAAPNPELTRSTQKSGAARQIEAGRRYLEGGQYSMAIPRLLAGLEESQNPAEQTQAQYYLGLAYYRVGNYWEARERFDAYLAAAPEGPYAEETRGLLASLDGTVEQRYITTEELARQLAEARAHAAENPDDLGEQLALADLLWRNNLYDEAGSLYAVLLKKWPQLGRDTMLQSRIEVDSSGKVTVLSSEEINRRLAEREPLVVFNLTSFRSGRDQAWSRSYREIYYNVTGQVVNRGEEALNNVSLIVTIYGFGNSVYDTQTVNVGTLRPGAVRPFSVQFSSFDNIENVRRYDVVTSYE